jgi:spermidine synthase
MTPTTKPASALNSRFFLMAAEFFAGMSLMAVEIGANRLLAPYFSSSQIVWTIVIGTIMIAMALGNVWGGRTADRDPNPDRLFRRFLVAAVWIAGIPAIGKYIVIGISGLVIFAVSGNYLIWAALASCVVLFVFPLFLLGTTTPSLCRYIITSTEDSGSVVGRLGAANTIGSIIGTFLPTFVTIPATGTAVTFLIFGGVLLAVAAVYFIGEAVGGKRRGLVGLIISCLLFAIFCVFGHSGSFAFWEKGLAYEGESVYNYLQVKEDERSVILSTNVLVGVQSIRMKQDGLTGLYYDDALAAPMMTEAGDSPKVLILGNGTGTYMNQLRRYFPGSHVDGVEIDEKITDLAEEYFDLDTNDPNIKVYSGDGRAFINANTKKYDVIMVDAYQDITIPFSMSSAEFFTKVRDLLSPGGVMVMNMNMRSGEDGINGHLCDTAASVFNSVFSEDVSGSTNREVFASMTPPEKLLEIFEENTASCTDPRLAAHMRRVYLRLEPYTPGNRILTDDKAPVELLGMAALDKIIEEEISYFKNIFKSEGISGLIKSVS